MGEFGTRAHQTMRGGAARGCESELCVERDHVLSDVKDSFAKGHRRKHLNLVAVAEYPPCDFAQTVDAKFDGGRAVAVANNLLRAVPLYFGDFIRYFGQEPQLDIVDSAFRYH